VLRWHLEHGIVVIPKSANPERIAANLDRFGFTLTPDEVARIDDLRQVTGGFSRTPGGARPQVGKNFLFST
jgi:diketogulonate reductase-like aldo/keto reductase